jgi:hypothetical protein
MTMSGNYMALSRQAVRNVLDAVPTHLFYKLRGKLEPDTDFKEEATREWAGQDFSQGDTAHTRTSRAWKFSWESRIWPSEELALLLEFLFRHASAPTTIDTSATKVVYRSDSEMYDDTEAFDEAIALLPHTQVGATTTHQQFLGGRIMDAELDFQGGSDAILKMNLTGGPWIGEPGQAEVAGVSFPSSRHFKSGNLKCFIGTGATLTGTAPDYTDIAEGAMAAFKPDSLNVKINTGLEDKFKTNGQDGPSVSERTKSWDCSVEGTVDFNDPSSGWSSRDAWAAQFADIEYVPFMMKVDSGDLIGAATQTAQLYLYWPKMKITLDMPARKTDGSKTKVKVKLESLVDPATNICVFAKLVY